MSTDNRPCEHLLSYFLEEMTELETRAFDRHLAVCPACQEELQQLREAWSTLPYSLEEVEPPANMKAEVLGAIVQEAPAKNQRAWSYGNSTGRTRRSPRRYAITAVASLLLIGGVSWFGFANWKMTPAELTDLSLPAQMVGQYNLKSFDTSSPGARGQAFLMQKGDSVQLVLQASGLPSLQGDQAYQVWIVKSGNRVNGGTFRVDAQGNGVLTFKFDVDNRQFDTIGITLEPDSDGVKPRGKKVLGT